jgi:hypothetical protein
VPWSPGFACAWGAAAPALRRHAWVEADGIMVDEDYPAGYFRLLFKVP